MKKINQAKRLKYFDENSGYAEKFIDEFWYVKHWHGKLKTWVVDCMTEEKYQRMKSYTTPKPKTFKSNPIFSEPWRCVLCNEITGYGRIEDVPLHHCKDSSVQKGIARTVT